jgi:hypothetical protein
MQFLKVVDDLLDRRDRLWLGLRMPDPNDLLFSGKNHHGNKKNSNKDE